MSAIKSRESQKYSLPLDIKMNSKEDPTFIIICGKKGSGKSTLGNHLEKNFNFTQFSFASKLKDIVSKEFNLDRIKLEGFTEEDRKWRETFLVKVSKNSELSFSSKAGHQAELIFPIFAGHQGILIPTEKSFTPRQLLQEIGESCKEKDENFWAKQLHKSIKEFLKEKKQKNIVITDLRFESELSFLKSTLPSLGKMYVIKIEKEDSSLTNSVENCHVSEKQVDFIIPNFKIINKYDNNFFIETDQVLKNLI
jgi:hypothetical protein